MPTPINVTNRVRQMAMTAITMFSCIYAVFDKKLSLRESCVGDGCFESAGSFLARGMKGY
jgi:hypothetical protein